MRGKRKYVAPRRALSASDTRNRILEAARRQFSRAGVDAVSIDAIARSASVSASTVYASFGSKAGILRALLRRAIFGDAYQEVAGRLESVADPVQILAVTASIARTIYENEAREVGLLRGVAMFSPQLKELEMEFERARLKLQETRIDRLLARKAIRGDIRKERVRQIMWMYTSRDIYRMLVVESAWSPDEYERWLRETLIVALLKPEAAAAFA